MALRIKHKKEIVKQVNQISQSALSAVVADYQGLTVSQMTDLRKKARDQHVYLRVVRNTLARRAVEGTDYACLKEVLVGPIILAFSQEDPGAGARLLKDFAKENEKCEVKALSINGQLLPASQIDVLAKLPTLDQARAQLAGTLIAPITKLVRTLHDIPGKVTRVVSAVAEKKKNET